jgi:hypothetical protein
MIQLWKEWTFWLRRQRITVHEPHLASNDDHHHGEAVATSKGMGLVDPLRYGASLGGPLCHTHNPTLRLFSRAFWHRMSS